MLTCQHVTCNMPTCRKVRPFLTSLFNITNLIFQPEFCFSAFNLFCRLPSANFTVRRRGKHLKSSLMHCNVQWTLLIVDTGTNGSYIRQYFCNKVVFGTWLKWLDIVHIISVVHCTYVRIVCDINSSMTWHTCIHTYDIKVSLNFFHYSPFPHRL